MLILRYTVRIIFVVLFILGTTSAYKRFVDTYEGKTPYELEKQGYLDKIVRYEDQIEQHGQQNKPSNTPFATLSVALNPVGG